MPERLFDQQMFKEALKALPDFFRQRTSVTRDEVRDNQSNVLLYVMQHSLRLQENPALDTARYFANYLNLELQIVTLLPYQDQTPERRLNFVLDAAIELSQQTDFAYRYYLHPQKYTKYLRKDLSKQASIIVLDTPEQSTQQQWLQVTNGPVLSVSSNCLYHNVQHCNNFGFYLHQVKNNYGLHNPYPETDWPVIRYNFVLKTRYDNDGLQPDCIADLNLDHRTYLVPDIIGGEKAGGKLWQRIKDTLFMRYPKIKRYGFEDSGGVLIPYLQYGMLSIFTLQNDCYIAGSKQAQHFSRAFLLWHEYLMQGFNNQDHKPKEKVEAELRQRLEGGQTSNEALNHGARSVMKTGLVIPQLLNEIESSIAKTTLEKDWSAILAFFEDWGLNRFIVPQCPQSFDDNTDQHFELKNLNLRKPRRSKHRQRKIAIIGGGLTGLTAARSLTNHDYDIAIFEASDAMGGRLQFEDLKGHDITTGTPFFSANFEGPQREIALWEELNLVKRWWPNIAHQTPGKGSSLAFKQKPYLPSPKLLDYLSDNQAHNITISRGTPIEHIETVTGGYRLFGTHEENLGFYDYVVVATSPDATLKLVPNLPLELIPSVTWSLMVKFSKPLYTNKDIFTYDNNFLDFSVRFTNIPGYSLYKTGEDFWVLYSNPSYVQKHNINPETSDKSVLKALFTSFKKSFSNDIQSPAALNIRKWVQYYPVEPIGKPYIEQGGLIIAGDWLLGKRVEDAIQSGFGTASRLRSLLR